MRSYLRFVDTHCWPNAANQWLPTKWTPVSPQRATGHGTRATHIEQLPFRVWVVGRRRRLAFNCWVNPLHITLCLITNNRHTHTHTYTLVHTPMQTPFRFSWQWFIRITFIDSLCGQIINGVIDWLDYLVIRSGSLLSLDGESLDHKKITEIFKIYIDIDIDCDYESIVNLRVPTILRSRYIYSQFYTYYDHS